MRKQIAVAAMISLMTASTTVAQGLPATQPEPETKMRSPALALSGLLMAVTGLVMVAPRGEEYNIVGTSYCVTNEGRNVDYGSCERGPTTKQIGFFLLVAGVPMTWIGMQDVQVKPMIGPGVKGVNATIRWGGK